jgi:hypothetical protein
MSLTKQTQIRLEVRIDALENDVREIYSMLVGVQKDKSASNKFAKKSIEEKILQTHSELMLVAKEAGVVLPSNS